MFTQSEESVTEARAKAAEAVVADLVASQAWFDLVTIFEALRDMGDSVGTPRAAREQLAADGSVLVADERVADTLPPRAIR